MISEIVYEEYLGFLKKSLSSIRLQHSLGVMQVMKELSPIYSLDPDQAMIAGLLHDAAKDLSLEKQLALAEEVGLEFHDVCEKHPIYIHAPVGAYLVKRDLKITDNFVLDAIAAHSFSSGLNNFNTSLSQCLRFADLLAPVTEWDGMKKFKSVVYSGNANEAQLLQCGWLMEFFREKQMPIHPNVVSEFQTLSNKLGVSASFFDRF